MVVSLAVLQRYFAVVDLLYSNFKLCLVFQQFFSRSLGWLGCCKPPLPYRKPLSPVWLDIRLYYCHCPSIQAPGEHPFIDESMSDSTTIDGDAHRFSLLLPDLHLADLLLYIPNKLRSCKRAAQGTVKTWMTFQNLAIAFSSRRA